MMDAIQVHMLDKNALSGGKDCYLIASTHPLSGNPFSSLEVPCEHTYVFSNLRLASYLAKNTGVYSIYLGWYTEDEYAEVFKW